MTNQSLVGLGFILTGACFMLIAWNGINSSDDLQQQQDLYCEMVAIHKNTGGQYGWPDYKHIAERVCQ